MIQYHMYVQCSKYTISNCTQSIYNYHTYCIKNKAQTNTLQTLDFA